MKMLISDENRIFKPPSLRVILLTWREKRWGWGTKCPVKNDSQRNVC
jgi:hypothetical protein